MICSQCNKEFNPTHPLQKNCSKKCTNRKANKKFSQTIKGKETIKKQNQSEAAKKYRNSDRNKEVQKNFLESEKGKVYLENRKEIGKKFRNSDEGKAWRKKYEKSDAGIRSFKKYRESDKFKSTLSKYEKERRKSDPIFKLVGNMRTRLRHFYKAKNISKKNSTFIMVGCTPEFLKKHLEKQFYPHPITNEKMTWKNHTLHGWHVDHIIPVSSVKTIEEKYRLCHYKNLQPLWAPDNWEKGSKIL